MQELFLTAITQAPQILVSTLVYLLSVSFFVFSCSKGHSVKVYLDTIQMALVFSSSPNESSREMLKTDAQKETQTRDIKKKLPK